MADQKGKEDGSAAKGGGASLPRSAVQDLVDDVPDPDEDDLDDLDDMLEDFSAVKMDAPKPAARPASDRATETAAARQVVEDRTTVVDDELLSDDDFAKQLQAGMAELLGEVEASPEMQVQFERIFKELGAAAGGAEFEDVAGKPESAAAAGPGAASDGARGGADASFPDTIRRTMERMQASGDQATAAAAAAEPDDFLGQLLQQMEAGAGEGSEEEFSKMLVGMMEQLTNKDILYEPMRELHDKFPGWLEKHGGSTPAADLKRYEEQQRLVAEMVAKFEEAAYQDSNPADREYIVDRMQKMQAAGSPPADLVGDMPSAQDALNATDESCNPQ